MSTTPIPKDPHHALRFFLAKLLEWEELPIIDLSLRYRLPSGAVEAVRFDFKNRTTSSGGR